MVDPLPYPGARRWVKITGVVAAVLALVVLIVILAGGGPGRHGPGRHMPASAESGPSR